MFQIEYGNVQICLSQGFMKICIINKVLQPTRLSLMDVLSRTNKFSIMNELIQKSSLNKLLHQNKFINKICFTDKICLPIIGNMKHHFKELLKANQYTIHIFDDDFFNNQMNHKQLTILKTNKKLREEFLLQHIFLGILQHDKEENDSRLIATSAKKMQPVSEWLWSDGKPIISKPGDAVFVVDHEMRVKEGLVQVLERLG